MEHRFSKKKSRRSRKKSTPLSSTTTSSSDSQNHTLTSDSTTTSDNYQDPYKKAQKSKISVPEGTKFDGYESDHVPTLPERCALTLSSFRPTPRKISRLSLPNSLTSTPPPSPASTTNSSTTTTSPSPLLDSEEVIKPKSLWNVNTSKKQMGVRYSLRSVIGDGTDQPDGPTVMDRRSLRPNGCHLNVSHWSADGLRPYMEDRYVIDELRNTTPSPSKSKSKSRSRNFSSSPSTSFKPFSVPWTFFGVFDGHGGSKASQFCSDRFTTYLHHQPTYPHDMSTSLKHSFLQMDTDTVQSRYTDGSTACVCALHGRSHLICANAGDSRAMVIRRDGSVAKLSRDHKPGVPEETQRITELGGRIVYWGRWRVEGILAVSRSIGDAALKPFITAEPEICEYRIEEEDMFLILATDGIWDVMDNLKVADFILSETCSFQDGILVTDSEKLKRVARNLCDAAGSFGSTDNVSAVIVDLKSQPT